MPILAFDPVPPEIAELRKRREQLGLDHRDEVWDGVLHMIPPPSTRHQRTGVLLVELLAPVVRAAGLQLTLEVGIGEDEHNYRTPDLVVHRPDPAPQWNPTAALVVEILSPRDTAWDKLGFYAAHHVDELLYVDLDTHEVTWMVLRGGAYERMPCSRLIELDAAAVKRHLGWAQGGTDQPL